MERISHRARDNSYLIAFVPEKSFLSAILFVTRVTLGSYASCHARISYR